VHFTRTNQGIQYNTIQYNTIQKFIALSTHLQRFKQTNIYRIYEEKKEKGMQKSVPEHKMKF